MNGSSSVSLTKLICRNKQLNLQGSIIVFRNAPKNLTGTTQSPEFLSIYYLKLAQTYNMTTSFKCQTIKRHNGQKHSRNGSKGHVPCQSLEPHIFAVSKWTAVISIILPTINQISNSPHFGKNIYYQQCFIVEQPLPSNRQNHSSDEGSSSSVEA